MTTSEKVCRGTALPCRHFQCQKHFSALLQKKRLSPEDLPDIKQRIRSSFTLIELLVIKTVSLFHYFNKKSQKMPCNACKASASYGEAVLHICRRQMLHTFVGLTRQSVQDTKCFIRSSFTLIELLVVIAIISASFFIDSPPEKICSHHSKSPLFRQEEQGIGTLYGIKRNGAEEKSLPLPRKREVLFISSNCGMYRFPARGLRSHPAPGGSWFC